MTEEIIHKRIEHVDSFGNYKNGASTNSFFLFYVHKTSIETGSIVMHHSMILTVIRFFPHFQVDNFVLSRLALMYQERFFNNT